MEFKFTIELGTRGLPYVAFDPEAELHVRHQDGQVIVMGNAQGLTYLAKRLLSLAEFQGAPGYHVHLSPGRPLDEESHPVTIHRLPLGQ